MDDIARMLQSAARSRTAGQSVAALDSYRQAAALARHRGEPALLAHALRHVADIAAEQGAPAAALEAGREAVALYRGLPAAPLDLANALRTEALALRGLAREADAATIWREARALYELAGVPAGVEECDANLDPAAGEPGSR